MFYAVRSLEGTGKNLFISNTKIMIKGLKRHGFPSLFLIGDTGSTDPERN